MLEPLSPDGLTAREVANVQQAQQHDVIDQVAAVQRLSNGTGTAADQATVMDGSAARLVSASGTGFKIKPEGARALAISCGESIKILESIDHHVDRVTHAPNLGTLPGVQDIANFTAAVGGDDQGIRKAVESLKSTLNQMMTAYEQAAKSYENVDQDVADAVKRFKVPSDPQT